ALLELGRKLAAQAVAEVAFVDGSPGELVRDLEGHGGLCRPQPGPCHNRGRGNPAPQKPTSPDHHAILPRFFYLCQALRHGTAVLARCQSEEQGCPMANSAAKPALDVACSNGLKGVVIALTDDLQKKLGPLTLNYGSTKQLTERATAATDVVIM